MSIPYLVSHTPFPSVAFSPVPTNTIPSIFPANTGISDCNLDNSCIPTSARWVSGPESRGTLQIITLCLSTLLLYVWNAYHPDIPTYRRSATQSVMHNAAWIFSALFCPEILLIIAFCQRKTAKLLLKEASEASFPTPGRIVAKDRSSGDEELKELASRGAELGRRHPFTLMHAFYACMGGYAFDFADDGSPTFLPGGRTRMAISPSGVRFLMKYDPDLIPDLSEYSITDRANTSSFSKAVLIGQVVWFCANCIYRMAPREDKPAGEFSLLEVLTLIHGVSTFMTCAFWWSKPQNIAEPTIITGERAREACALLAMCSTEKQYHYYGLLQWTSLPAEIEYLTPSQSSDGSEFKPNGVTYTMVVTGGVSAALGFSADSPVPWYALQGTYNDGSSTQPLIPRLEDNERWILASKAMRRYGLTFFDLKYLRPLPYISPKSTLQAASEMEKKGQTRAYSSVMIARAGAYSSLRVLTGIRDIVIFPTSVERHLWLAAAIVIAAAPMAVGISLLIFAIMKRCGVSRRIIIPMRLAGQAALYFLHFVAAGYLLGESLRQLFYLPDAAYGMPSWSSDWPHVS